MVSSFKKTLKVELELLRAVNMFLVVEKKLEEEYFTLLIDNNKYMKDSDIIMS